MAFAGTPDVDPWGPDDEFGDEVDCTWCAGEGTAECLAPLGCPVPHRFGDECICTACRGTGLRSQQTVF